MKIKSEGLKNKKSLLESTERQRASITVWLEQREWTGLGRICDMEIGYQVEGMSKFGCGNLLKFIFSIFIS